MKQCWLIGRRERREKPEEILMEMESLGNWALGADRGLCTSGGEVVDGETEHIVRELEDARAELSQHKRLREAVRRVLVRLQTGT